MIDIHNLSLSINGQAILRGIELHIQPGEIYGLLGPNGAGKTTTIFALLGLRSPSAGQINVLGHDPKSHALDIRRTVGVMPEHAGFYGWMTATAYLSWSARLYGPSTSPKKIDKLLNRVGLGAVGRNAVQSFSRGMKQRLAIARALISNPRLLILDEPTNGLDPKGRREIHDLLLDFVADQDTGVLLCTHLLDDVDRLCHRVGIVDAGRTRFEGRLHDLMSEQSSGHNYRLRLDHAPEITKLPTGMSLLEKEGAWWRVHLDPDIPGGPAALWGEMWQHGWRILEIRSEASNLEELYLKITAPNEPGLQEKMS